LSASFDTVNHDTRQEHRGDKDGVVLASVLGLPQRTDSSLSSIDVGHSRSHPTADSIDIAPSQAFSLTFVVILTTHWHYHASLW